MKLYKELLGKYVVASRGVGPVMRVTCHVINNDFHLRYKCEWTQNGDVKQELFKFHQLKIVTEDYIPAHKARSRSISRGKK